MPRIIPITVFTGRTKPNTEYTKPRDRTESPVSFDSVQITFDSDVYTWDAIFQDLWPLTTSYNTPRYAKYVEDLTGINVLDLSWEQVLWVSWNRVNKIDTVFT